MSRKSTLPNLRKRAWAAFSKYVRGEGYVPCVTCGISRLASEMHAGHFVHCSRQSPLSYDVRNVHPQCRQCNFYGMQGEAAIKYTQYMQDKYGPGIVDELLAMKHSKNYLKRDDLQAIIDKYS